MCLAGGIRRLEGTCAIGGIGLGHVPRWRYQVRRPYASLEVSEGWKETCATGGIGLGDVSC
jgi:hypothetical protein